MRPQGDDVEGLLIWAIGARKVDRAEGLQVDELTRLRQAERGRDGTVAVAAVGRLGARISSGPQASARSAHPQAELIWQVAQEALTGRQLADAARLARFLHRCGSTDPRHELDEDDLATWSAIVTALDDALAARRG